MIIETKFNVGDVAWYNKSFSHKAATTRIMAIQILVGKNNKPIIHYNRIDGVLTTANKLYKTKEEAEKSRENET